MINRSVADVTDLLTTTDSSKTKSVTTVAGQQFVASSKSRRELKVFDNKMNSFVDFVTVC